MQPYYIIRNNFNNIEGNKVWVCGSFFSMKFKKKQFKVLKFQYELLLKLLTNMITSFSERYCEYLLLFINEKMFRI